MSTLVMPTENAQFSDSLARAFLTGFGAVPPTNEDPALTPLLQAVLQQLNACGQPVQPKPKTQSVAAPASINISLRMPPPITVGTPPAGYTAEFPSLYTTPEPTPTHSSRSHTPPRTESEGSCEDVESLYGQNAQRAQAALTTTAAVQLDPKTPLRQAWVYWASWKLETEQLGTMEDCRPIGECATMGEFWDGFSRLLVADMPVNVSLQLLRKGVPPMYDHPENRNGGHFKIRAASMAAACTLWSQLTVAIAREQLPYADQVQGCNVVKKLRSTTLQVWVVNSLFKATVEAIRLYLLTNLPRGDYLRLKFCPHKYLLRTLQTKRSQRRGGFDDDF